MKHNRSRFQAFLSLVLSLSLLLPAAAGPLAMAETAPEAEPAPAQSAKLALTPDQITDESIAFIADSYITPAQVLLDEQDKLPDTPDEKLPEAPTSRNWSPLKKNDYCPISCYIDLGAYYFITEIGLFDNNGSCDVTFRTGEPFQWEDAFTVTTNMYRAWRVFPVEAESTRYVQIEANSCDGGINELALYGYRDDSKEATEDGYVPQEKPVTTADAACGVNAFIDDPLDILQTLGNVREYHNLTFTTKDGLNYFSPSANGYWDFDAYYRDLHERGVEAIPCIQGTADWILGDGGKYESSNNIPIPAGADASDPLSYEAHASVMYQFAARYGAETVDESTLLLGENQEPKTGLGYLRIYEDFNEQNKDWEGKASYMTPYEYAAMCSADYDGHESALGDTYGIANADPAAKLAMGGLVGKSVIPYLNAMKFWFEHNRSDGKFVPDIINFHQYVTEDCPEESDFKPYLEELAAWRDENLPDKELWCSEFNVVASDKVKEGVSNRDNADYLEARGSRLTRAYLLALSAGIDKLSMFMSRDTSWGVYADDGLVTEKGAWVKKPAWYYVSTMKDALTNMVFDETVCEDDNLYIYKFRDADDSSKEVYALWSPTIDGSAIDGYTLDIGGAEKATLTELEPGFSDGVKRHLDITDGTVSVDVSERPIFVTVSGNDVLRPDPTMQKIPVSPEMISTDDTYMQSFQNLFDQQDDVPRGPTMALDKTVKFETSFGNYHHVPLPISATIDLGEEYVITHIGFYDTYGTGKIELLEGAPGGWNEDTAVSYGLNTYMSWKVLETNLRTRYLRINKYDNAELTQIGLFGYRVSELDTETPVDTTPRLLSLSPADIAPNKEKYADDVQKFLDEQDLMPEFPDGKLLTAPVTRHQSYWGKSADFPMTGIIDLGGEYVITHIAFYDTFDVGRIDFTAGDGMNWDTDHTLTDRLGYYQHWTVLDTNLRGTHLKVDKFDNAVLNEIAVYGYRVK